jgi:hypothetical protein
MASHVAPYPVYVEGPRAALPRRGLPLIGWWLAGLPHYVIVGIFVGTPLMTPETGDDEAWISLIVLGVGLLLALPAASGFHRAFRRR